MNPTLSTSLVLLVALFAFLGAMAAGMLLWLNQKPRPPFDAGSFAVTAITAVGAAIGIAEVFNYTGVTNTTLACFAAFLSGMGGNTVIGGIAGAVVKKPVPAAKVGGFSPRPQFIWGAFYRRI